MRLRFVGAAGAASEACGRRVGHLGHRGEGRRMARTEIWKYRWWGQARIERSGGGGGQGVTDGAMFDLRICDGREREGMPEMRLVPGKGAKPGE